MEKRLKPVDNQSVIPGSTGMDSNSCVQVCRSEDEEMTSKDAPIDSGASSESDSFLEQPQMN